MVPKTLGGYTCLSFGIILPALLECLESQMASIRGFTMLSQTFLLLAEILVCNSETIFLYPFLLTLWVFILFYFILLLTYLRTFDLELGLLRQNFSSRFVFISSEPRVWLKLTNEQRS